MCKTLYLNKKYCTLSFEKCANDWMPSETKLRDPCLGGVSIIFAHSASLTSESNPITFKSI